MHLQKCADAAFCNRLLGSKDEGYMVDPASVNIAGSKLLCSVQNKENPDLDLKLTLTSYGSFVRLHINEDPLKGRFEVPGVLQKGLAGDNRHLNFASSEMRYFLASCLILFLHREHAALCVAT